MGSTTLVTFRLQAPSSTTSVNLLGSWDNFSKPYPMQRDQRMGLGHWRGCHSFVNIICDGDSPQMSGSRNGGLKMGGKYWYYYQLDGDIEYHDPTEPFITSCPLLPGQEVNVLEVPIQIQPSHTSGRRRSTSSTNSAGFTLNPEDKYLAPSPPVYLATLRRASSTSSILSLRGAEAQSFRNISATNVPYLSKAAGQLELQVADPLGDFPRSISAKSMIHSEPASRCTSLWAAFNQRKVARTANPALETSINPLHSPMDGLTLSPATTFLEQSTMFDLDPITSKMSSKSEGGACQDEVLFPTKYLPKASHMALTIPYKGQAVLRKASTDSASIAIDVGYGAMNVQQPSISVGPSNVLDEINIYHSSLEPIDSVDSENIQNSLPLLRMDFENFGREDDWRHIPLPDSAKASVGSQTGADLFLRTHAGPESYHADLALFPCTASGLLSPTLSSATGLSGCMTSTHLSQPETPTISEFDIDGRIGGIDRIEPSVSGGYELEEPLKDTMCAKHGGFDGYNLPEAEHGSALTLKNLETTGSRGSSHESHFAGKDGNDLVRSWNDGSEHNRGAMAELFKDLAYLGEMIV